MYTKLLSWLPSLSKPPDDPNAPTNQGQVYQRLVNVIGDFQAQVIKFFDDINARVTNLETTTQGDRDNQGRRIMKLEVEMASRENEGKNLKENLEQRENVRLP